MDITELQNALGTNVTNSVTSEVQDQLGKLIAWILIPSIILTVIILGIYIAHIIHRHKIDKAIIEIRDTLREMKLAQVAAPAEPRPNTEQPASVPATTPSDTPVTPKPAHDENASANSST